MKGNSRFIGIWTKGIALLCEKIDLIRKMKKKLWRFC